MTTSKALKYSEFIQNDSKQLFKNSSKNIFTFKRFLGSFCFPQEKEKM